MEVIFFLRQVIEQLWDKECDYYMVFIDIKKAYYRVLENVNGHSLGRKKCSKMHIVRATGCELDDFSITFGLHQGSSLNPHLFDIVMNEYINRI